MLQEKGRMGDPKVNNKRDLNRIGPPHSSAIHVDRLGILLMKAELMKIGNVSIARVSDTLPGIALCQRNKENDPGDHFLRQQMNLKAQIKEMPLLPWG